MRTRATTGVAVAVAVLAAACGGSGGSSAASSTGPPTTADGSGTTGTSPSVDSSAPADGIIEAPDGLERTYRLHVPESIGTDPVPLVVGLHGGLGSGAQFAGESGLEDLADQEGFVVAFPDGSSPRRPNARTWNAGNCCGGAAAEEVDDVGFIRALVDEIAAAEPIDRDRVYAVGHSNGGMLAYRLACEAADVFAAVGLQAGALEVDDCRPSEPVGLVHVHGRADTSVPLGGGMGSGIAGVPFRSNADSIAAIVAADRCGPVPDEVVDGVLTTSTWSCADGAQVRLTLVEDGAHGWFGGTRAEQRDGATDVNSTELIWDFLEGQSQG